jgi:hypothetical protein
MSYKILTNGTAADADEVMGLFEEGYRIQGQSIINTLQDRAITFPADGGIFAEAYTDADGRLDSVDTGDTTALFDTNKYRPRFEDISGDTTSSAVSQGSWADTDNAFDRDRATTATHSFTANGYSGSYTCSLGKTFSAKTIGDVYIKCSGTAMGSGTRTITITLESYNGSSWSTEGATLVTGNNTTVSFDGYRTLNKSVQGLRILYSTNVGAGTANQLLYELSYGDMEESIITHDIPANTFSSTLSSSFATFKAVGWETGADVQYKLTNATEDTGYLNMNEVAEFTALTSTPTKMIVKLIPEGTAPTSGFPSVSGVTLFADKP